MDTTKKLNEIICKHYTLPPLIEQYARQANYDLYFGPFEAGEPIDCEEIYPGFQSATKAVRDWVDSNIDTELYIDMDLEEVIPCPDETYIDEETGELIETSWENIYQLRLKEILKALFGKEIPGYL